MNKFGSFVIKESKHILRDRRLMMILFGMPVALMLLFGFAINNDVKNVRTVAVMSSADHLTSRIVQKISNSEYFKLIGTVATPEEAKRIIMDQKADLALVFAPRFASKSKERQLMVDATDPNMAQQWTNYATNVILNIQDNPINVKMLYNPQMKSSYSFVPAIMGVLLMLICAMMTSIAIVKEKEKGTMEVLLVSPVKPIMIVVSKVIPYLVIAIAIMATILLMSKYVLEIPIQGSLFPIVTVSIIYIVLALSLGMLISNVAKTQFAALLLSVMVLLMPIVMLSGMIFPVESMPVVLQCVSAVIPTRYYIDAMRKIMIMGLGLEGVTKELIILSGMTIFLLTLSLMKFNKRLE